ncbi:MAG: elongation factor P [Rhabdochlamydiaceae bacterium]|nr:elongation factor P [Candidatus Amphrikana amoebophyrae]
MGKVNCNDLRGGMKVEVDGEPYTIISLDFVKPGKGQAFTRSKLKHLTSNRTLEKTFKSTDKLDTADVEERTMRLLYAEQNEATFMDDNTFDQIAVPMTAIGENRVWLLEETLYDIVLYKGEVATITPPNFLNLVITETAPGVRGDTASGRVMKPATLETGATVQVPIFIEEGEKIKVDTRNCEYVSRS